MNNETFCQLVENHDKDGYIAIFVHSREILYQMLLDGTRDHTKPILEIKMPCGEIYTFMTREDLPTETLMCRCKNKKHAVIKYSEENL